MKADVSAPVILLLGGARAGKSAHALQLAAAHVHGSETKVSFIATAQGLDEEMKERIARHQAERPGDWRTIEEPYWIDQALQKTGETDIVIVDCLTLFVSNWLLRYDDEHDCTQVVRRITRNLLDLARSRQQTIICVSNEAGLGVVPPTQLGRVFRDLLGWVNQEFAVAADEVYLLVAGISLQLKPTA